MFLDPGGDTGKVLVLLSDVILLAQVDEVDYWLCGEKEERVDELDLIMELVSSNKTIYQTINRV